MLGPYEIIELIRAGGMGEVYRAADTRLHRDVAIKVSSATFSERFEREARVIASLNHPNICTLFVVSYRDNVMGLYAKSANGAGSDEVLLKQALGDRLTDWSPDGRFLIFVAGDPLATWILPLEGDR